MYGAVDGGCADATMAEPTMAINAISERETKFRSLTDPICLFCADSLKNSAELDGRSEIRVAQVKADSSRTREPKDRCLRRESSSSMLAQLESAT